MLKYFEVFEECPPYALCTSVPLSEGKGSENHCPVWELTTSEDSRGRDNEPSVAGELYSKLFQRLNSSSKATLSGTFQGLIGPAQSSLVRLQRGDA